jgi:hypothetical protein
MGIGFTIDTPVKVAHYGISSVVSLVDDILMEKMRKFYCNKLGIPFTAITDKVDDFRAKRITAYLNLLHQIVKDRFEEFKNSVSEKSDEFDKYLNILPDYSLIKNGLKKFINKNNCKAELKNWLDNNSAPGSIDVNIMTKLDKQNYHKDEVLPVEYNDAHAALRGFANSKLNSSIVLSAGLNPRLYSYFEKFDDFYPDENGLITKKIVLKVSDYRSAIIQGKFLAKKGLWVSEYRIESGLNCGGHAFASDGFLMGPILEEFRLNRNSLINTTHNILLESLKNKNRPYPGLPIAIKVTAQGGVGTSDEHKFLLDYYKLDSVGWGTPFLLVPEVTNVDEQTRNMLTKATEEDLYLSKISPLGIPFNSLRGNTKDIEKLKLIEKGRPGSSCPKKYLVSNTEFTEKAICAASRQFQSLKLKELDLMNLSPELQKEQFNRIVDKSCICVGLGTTPLINNDIDRKVEGESVSICPGPNMAYFSEVVSLNKMVNHIYGRTNIIIRDDRPNMYIKELALYIDYLKEKIEEASQPFTDKQKKYFEIFMQNMNDGIDYYKDLFSNVKVNFENTKSNLLDELAELEKELGVINLEILAGFNPEPILEKAV